MNYCSDCGTEAMTSGLWPYTCDGCGVVHYCPPKPVVAILIPGSAPNSWVLIKRGREPFANGWAFPGGYLDHKEQWREAAVRETQEEIGLRLDPEDFQLLGIEPTFDNFTVLVCLYVGGPMRRAAMHTEPVVATGGEILGIELCVNTGQELVVPSHNRVWQGLPGWLAKYPAR